MEFKWKFINPVIIMSLLITLFVVLTKDPIVYVNPL